MKNPLYRRAVVELMRLVALIEQRILQDPNSKDYISLAPKPP
jgi:hypothetical protein